MEIHPAQLPTWSSSAAGSTSGGLVEELEAAVLCAGGSNTKTEHSPGICRHRRPPDLLVGHSLDHERRAALWIQDFDPQLAAVCPREDRDV